jgi:hypothetical protein
MISDFFTKPVQGKRFRMLRDLILNVSQSDSSVGHRSVLVNSNNMNGLPEESEMTEKRRES